MKLRNKRTGEIFEAYKDEPIDLFIYLGTDEEGDELNRKTYHSIAELNEEWEDYKPAEPLIKDKLIRKAVRAWAEVNGSFEGIKICTLTAGTRFSIGHYVIEFMGYFIYDLESNKTYTIAELCGEEE